MAGFGRERSWNGDYPKNKENFPFWSERIQKAYEIGAKAHEGQKRVTTGEPYFNHCVEVAGIIESWCYTKESKFVEDLVIAALLHDTVEDTELTLEEIENEFGPEVAFLVDGVSKFKSEGVEGTDQETIKKVLEGYFVDPRVAILKLADRVQNMRSLKDMPTHKQEPKAIETEEVYARIAEALGMWEVMRNLKDAAFPFRFNRRFEEVRNILDKDPRRNEDYVLGLCNDIRRVVDGEGNRVEIGYRMAGYRQIDQKRRKMRRVLEENGYEAVSEVVSINLIVGSVDECYRTLGLLRQYYGSSIDQSRSQDLISVPADNGYTALKEVLDLGFGAIEVVIMTKEMEEFNNWGVVSLIRAGVEDLAGFRMKIIFTPDNEIRVLPLTATGWDVAAAINQEMVKGMTGILVNGDLWLPSMQIPHAAKIEVVVRKRGTFLEDKSWETASLPSTRRILERSVERYRYQSMIEWGRIEAKLLLAGRGVLDFDDIADEMVPKLSELGCRDIGELLFLIGAGEIDKQRLDKVLDGGRSINKQTLGLTTVLVTGRDEPRVLHRLTGVISNLGGNIVRSVNRGDREFEIRIVIRGIDAEKEERLRKELEESGKFKEVLVV